MLKTVFVFVHGCEHAVLNGKIGRFLFQQIRDSTLRSLRSCAQSSPDTVYHDRKNRDEEIDERLLPDKETLLCNCITGTQYYHVYAGKDG